VECPGGKQSLFLGCSGIQLETGKTWQTCQDNQQLLDIQTRCFLDRSPFVTSVHRAGSRSWRNE